MLSAAVALSVSGIAAPSGNVARRRGAPGGGWPSPRAAVATSVSVIAAPSVNGTWRKGRRRATLLVPDARVEEPVGEVDGEVDDDDAGGEGKRHPPHPRQGSGP